MGTVTKVTVVPLQQVDPIELANGETRSFLEDGDEVTLKAWCESEGGLRIGFGECVGRVVPAG